MTSSSAHLWTTVARTLRPTYGARANASEAVRAVQRRRRSRDEALRVLDAAARMAQREAQTGIRR